VAVAELELNPKTLDLILRPGKQKRKYPPHPRTPPKLQKKKNQGTLSAC